MSVLKQAPFFGSVFVSIDVLVLGGDTARDLHMMVMLNSHHVSASLERLVSGFWG